MGSVEAEHPSSHITPRIETSSAGCHQLVVDGKPFLMLAAELHNSSFSCPDHMKSIWPALVEANINTVLGPVAWENIEPEEGVFDFSKLDQIIIDARSHGLHIVLLWFGSWKNGRSTYAPAWVKKNPKRFPRAIISKEGGKPKTADVLSPLSIEAMQADMRAFQALMHHLKEIDEGHSTVIMVQVQNEVGLLGDSRDRSDEANRRFNSPVPTRLIDALVDNRATIHDTLKQNLVEFYKRAGTTTNQSWEDVFGSGKHVDEIFMAYHYASYVEKVAAAGRSAYPLPLFTNVWQNYADTSDGGDNPVIAGGGDQPGDYPSGGAVIHVLDIWKMFAPTLDFIAPDIYLNDYDITCSRYRHLGQPLFVPEQRRDEYGLRRIWSAIGSHQALGASPFAVDSLQPSSNPLRKHYTLLRDMSSQILAAQKRPNSMVGFFFDDIDTKNGKAGDFHAAYFGGWDLRIERAFVFGKPSAGFGIIIFLGRSRFLLIGEGFQVRFASCTPGAHFTGILSFVEKVVTDPSTGAMKDGRTLNGDETISGEVARMPSEDPDLGGFPIVITIPAKTRVAECEVYALS